MHTQFLHSLPDIDQKLDHVFYSRQRKKFVRLIKKHTLLLYFMVVKCN